MDFNVLMGMLYQGNVYDGFDPSQHPDDMQGWNSTDPNFAAMITRYKPQLIVEVGSWKGGSAVHMLRLAREAGLQPTLLCVDTWQGGVEHRNFDATGYASLRPLHGYPTLYYTFLANIVRNKLHTQVVPFANTSLNAANWLARNRVNADLVFLDGSHAFEDVLMEMTLYYDLVKPGGALFGDDYNWNTVRAAVQAFARINQVTVEDRGVHWVIGKPNGKATVKLPQLLENSGAPNVHVGAPEVIALVEEQLNQLGSQVANLRRLLQFLQQNKVGQ